MTQPRIEERTLYPPTIEYLKKIGFQAIGESKVFDKHPDIYFKFDSVSFVIEIKIGTQEKVGLKAVAQAADYAKKLGTQNIILLFYPEKYRNQTILFPEKIDEVALTTKVQALVFTEFWTEALKTTVADLLANMRKRLEKKAAKHDLQTIVNLIKNFVTDLNSIVFQIRTEELITEVVEKLDLFSSIGDIKDKETAMRQVIDLASYLLFNQLLFYHIYQKKSRQLSKTLPELSEIRELIDIQKYLTAITAIDYQSIYRVNILGHIPKKPEVIDILNKVIKSIKLLRAEHITHDLAGRFFHDLIPFEVRKILAAFYTHPIAADILASLTINAWDEKVIDPACGSGTLLVSAYKRKKHLYTQLFGFKDMDILHKNFIEQDITGIDIMPFAAHITTINLTTQNIEQETNIVRIATKDSLSLSGSLVIDSFKQQGVKILPYTRAIQETLFLARENRLSEYEGAVSPRGKGEEFSIRPVDTVIMNPPFSDREKMPSDMRNRIKNNHILGDICGGQINLWGYFLALANLMLKPKGKIGVVIPINIARGKATEKIRNFLLDNFRIRYIVKPVGDLAFSEGAQFRDVLLIAEKSVPNLQDTVAIVFLKRSIRKMSIESNDVEEIVNKITQLPANEKSLKNKDFDVYVESYEELLRLRDNLMPIMGVSEIESINVFTKFLNSLQARGTGKLSTLKLDISEGFHASPAGLSQLTFITRPVNKERIERAFLILDEEERETIQAHLKNTDRRYKIEKSKTLPALRSLTNIDNFCIDNKRDYFIKREYNKSSSVLMLSKWKDKKTFTWKFVNEKVAGKETYLAVARRFNPHSPNTHHFAFCSAEKFIVPHTFKIIKASRDESKLQCLFLNSIIGLFNIISLKEQTTGQYTDIMESDLRLFYTINPEGLSKKEIKTLNDLFKKIKFVNFPSLLEQLEKRFWARLELDTTILKIVGLSSGEINEQLPAVYDALIRELKSLTRLGPKQIKQSKLI